MPRHPSEDFCVAGVRYFSPHKGEVNCCAFSPACDIILTCSDDGSLYLWEASSADLLAKARGHTGPVRCCVFSKDGGFFASASHDCSVRVWRTPSRECVHVLTGLFLLSRAPCVRAGFSIHYSCAQGHRRSVETVSFSADGRRLASGGWDNKVFLWDAQATGSWDRSVRVWGLHGDEEVVTLEGHRGNVACLCFSTVGLLASGSWDGTVRVWSVKSRTCVFVLEGSERVWVRCVAFSTDGLVLASTAEGDTVNIWDMVDGRCLKHLQGHKDSAYGCAFSPSGALLTSGSEQLDLGDEADLCNQQLEDEAQEHPPRRQKQVRWVKRDHSRTFQAQP
ncbi:WD repeat-containing protein 38 isoform X3 [Electrophorus electricus]|uniref:WD repeat-containing protein 38 isoform X3 n=1 Tax=Electrophorus electricus TaxID=8005 RepID=UPI0015CF8F48|nr:WD repeat-containing protein 38 isoform X3 [Electrophorus electricus]